MKKFYTVLFSIFFIFSFANSADAQTISAQRILELVNAERVRAGLGVVTFESRLNEAAGIKARDMAAKTYFDHISPDGTDPWDLLARVGYDWAWAGENLALNSQTLSEEAIVKAWMESPGHRAIILTESHTETGIGIATGTYNGMGVVYISQFFASPKKVVEPVVPTVNVEKVEEVKPKLVASTIYRTTPPPVTDINTATSGNNSDVNNDVNNRVSKPELISSTSATTSAEVVTSIPTTEISKPNKIWKMKFNLFVHKLLSFFATKVQAFKSSTG